MANKTKQIETMPFSKWTVEVHRRPMRRRISICLYPHRPIKVLVGVMTPQKNIHDFLMQKKDWIEKHLTKFNELAPPPPKKKIQSYEKLPFLGQERNLKISITVLPKPFMALQGEELHLHIPRDQWTAGAVTDEHPHLLGVIRDYYKREAVKVISERTQFWATQMNLHPKQLRFKEQRTRWGSCSSRGFINFNWRLSVFRPELIDYVIIHELAHLQHMDHSKRFWNLVEAFCPNYSALTKELRESHHMCEFLAAT